MSTRRRNVLVGWLIAGLGVLAAGCVAFIDEPRYPMPPPTAPRLLTIDLNPNTIPLRSPSNRIQVTLEYEDLDGDVDQAGASVLFRLTSTTYEVRGASEVRKAPETVERDPGSEFVRGRIITAIGIDTSNAYRPGSFTLTATLLDRAGHRSNSLQGIIYVGQQGSPGSGGGGVPPPPGGGGCRIWFTDGPQGPPTTVYRMGQQVFLMAEDTSIGELRIPFVTATIQNQHDQWQPPYTAQLYQTGEKYVFASAIGPRLGFAPWVAHSGDTLTAFYTARANPNDTCMALAKVQ